MDFEKTITEMRDLQDYVSGRLVDKKSFTDFVTAITKIWQQLQSDVTKYIGEHKKSVDNDIKTVRSEVKTSISGVEKSIKEAKKSIDESIYNNKSFLQSQIDENMRILSERIEEPVDFSEIYESMEEMREGIPEKYNPQELIDKIDELENEIEELKKRKNVTNIVNGGIVGKDVIKDIDLSTQLDGATKTFQTQAVYNVVSVSLSSYPYGSLRKGIDYTWTPTSITFTDEIDAATQLAVGQRCILTVVQ